jgi:hypothetical protein
MFCFVSRLVAIVIEISRSVDSVLAHLTTVFELMLIVSLVTTEWDTDGDGFQIWGIVLNILNELRVADMVWQGR